MVTCAGFDRCEPKYRIPTCNTLESAGVGVQEELRLFQWHSFNECEKMLSAV